MARTVTVGEVMTREVAGGVRLEVLRLAQHGLAIPARLAAHIVLHNPSAKTRRVAIDFGFGRGPATHSSGFMVKTGWERVEVELDVPTSESTATWVLASATGRPPRTQRWRASGTCQCRRPARRRQRRVLPSVATEARGDRCACSFGG